jgi:anti-sigma-K factor RskA
MSTQDPREDYDGCGEDAAAYVLGALTEQEAAAFAAHLQACAGCREEVAALQPVADVLPASVVQRSAPPELRDRVLGTVRAEAELRDASAARGAGPAGRRRRSLWSGSARRRGRGLALGALAAAVIAALVALALPGGGGSGTKVVRAQVSAPSASALLHVDRGRGRLEIAGMPQSPPGRVYEVWVERAGQAHPTDALFSVTSAGRASVGVPGSMNGVTAVMVTAEPKGGSSRPTSPAVIVARLG